MREVRSPVIPKHRSPKAVAILAIALGALVARAAPPQAISLAPGCAFPQLQGTLNDLQVTAKRPVDFGEFTGNEATAFVACARQESQGTGHVTIVTRDQPPLTIHGKAVMITKGEHGMSIKVIIDGTEKLVPFRNINKEATQAIRTAETTAFQARRPPKQVKNPEKPFLTWQQAGYQFTDPRQVAQKIARAKAQGQHTIQRSPLEAQVYVIDSNVIIGRIEAKLLTAAGKNWETDPALNAGYRKSAYWFSRKIKEGFRFAVADKTLQEVTEKNPIAPEVTLGLPITTSRTGPEYQSIYQQLEKPPYVGAKKGHADREIVTDLFFAQTDPGVVPTFVTADVDLYENLAARKFSQAELRKGVHLQGYDIELTDSNHQVHKIHVIPIR